MANILLAVTGSISAYKAADLVSQLTKEGHEVTVLMTTAATAFITPLTLQTLSKNKVYTDQMKETDADRIAHIDLGKETDLFIVAPASANTIAKLAQGFADDMVSATALALAPHIPKLIAPAMNTKMYLHPATQHNLQLLSSYGYEEIVPRSAILACGDVGIGALAELPHIFEKVRQILDEKKLR